MRDRHVYPSSRRPRRRQSYGLAGAAIVSKHHTHASVNIFARTHARLCLRRRRRLLPSLKHVDMTPPVIDVRDKVPSRWLQKLISDVAGVSNTTAISISNGSPRSRNGKVSTANIDLKSNLIYPGVSLKIFCLARKSKYFLEDASIYFFFFNYLRR